MRVDPDRVLRFRLAGHGLARGADGDVVAPLRTWAVQDSPPGAAAAAVAARAPGVAPGALDAALREERAAVALYNPRTATAVLPAGEAAAFATALLPAGDEELRVVVGSAVPERTEGFAEPVALAVGAVSDALDGTTLSRDDLHAELRRRLPAELLPWCPGCRSHHTRRGLLVMAGLHGRLCIAGRAGRQPAFARTDQWIGWEPPAPDAARAELVRRYLRAYGPSTPAELGAWAGIGGSQARALWSLVAGELAEVEVEGRSSLAWVLAADAGRLADPPPVPGVRLLAPGDPLLLGRDREPLLADEDRRREVWRATGGAGIVLHDGAAVGLWRARKQGRRLCLTVDTFGRAPREEVAGAAERLAPHRGCAGADVDWASG